MPKPVHRDPARRASAARALATPTRITWPRPRPADFVAAFALVVLACAFYGRISWEMITKPSDTKSYVDLAQQWTVTNQVPKSHFLFPELLMDVHSLGLSYPIAALVVVLFAYSMAAVALYVSLRLAAGAHAWFSRPELLAALSLAILLAQPLQFQSVYVIGYFWPTNLDNPTSALAKPFSIVMFLCVGGCLARSKRPAAAVCLLSAAATVLSALSKPSFLICLIPAAGLIAAIRWMRRMPVSIAGLTACLLLPGALVLVWQYTRTYAERAADANHDRIIWAPFEVMRHYASGLPLKFALSVAFPLAVTALFWPRVRRDVTMWLAWVSLLIGAFYGYTLAEDVRKWHGNFLWSPYAATFMLIVASAVFLLRERPETSGGLRAWWRHAVCAAVLLLHTAAGLEIMRKYWVYFLFRA